MALNSDHYVTMSIASLGEPTLPRQEPKPFQEKRTNDISDISGARSGPKYEQFYNKPQFLQSDVQGSTSKALSWGRNVRDNSLYIDDIDGTRHSIKDRMMRTGRHVDPLAPNYPLPSYVPAENPPTKFIKDPQDHSDIDGSYSKTKKYFATRDTMRVDDIAGTRPKQQRGSLDPGSMGHSGPDVSAPTHRFKDRTSRVTDPNNPQYHVNGMDYKDDKYTKPRTLPGYIADNHQLQTKDITGAAPGFKDTRFVRREIRNINYIDDIEGARADSIKHSITTNRQSNPLAPVYQSLDPGELLQPVVPPLIPASMVKVPTIPVQKGNKPKEPEQHGISFGASLPAHQFDAGNEFDPVIFASTMPDTGKPPSGRFQLDFSAAQQGGFGNSFGGGDGGYGGYDSGGFGGSARKSQQGSPFTSARGQQSVFTGLGSGGRTRIGNAAANNFSASGSGGGAYFNESGGLTGSARGNSGGAPKPTAISFLSPAPSARGGNSGRLTPQERRASLERSAEINSVRDLRQ